jgi:hypothetical protein
MLRRYRRAAMVTLWVVVQAQVARAQTQTQTRDSANGDDLAAARALFANALRDEEAKRFVDALDKFQRVRAVRDTAAIEYRIGTCFEGLGRAAPAYVAYREATVLGQDDVRSADVVAAALDRLHALAKQLGWLSLALPANASADVEVRVDDGVMPLEALREPLVLEPGRHVVTARARDARPFRSEIVLPEGAHVSLTIALEPVASPAPTAPPNPADVEPTMPPPPAPPIGHEGTSTVPGWITIAGGGALLLGSMGVAIGRSHDISTIKNACADGCSLGDRDSLESTRSRALAEGPIAIVLGGAGLVAAGVGVYLVVMAKDASRTGPASARLVPLLASGAGGLAFEGEFR